MLDRNDSKCHSAREIAVMRTFRRGPEARSLPVRTLALPWSCLRRMGSPDPANPFLNLSGNDVRSVQQLLSFDDQLPIPINSVLHRIFWGLHGTPRHTNYDSAGTSQCSRVATIVPAPTCSAITSGMRSSWARWAAGFGSFSTGLDRHFFQHLLHAVQHAIDHPLHALHLQS